MHDFVHAIQVDFHRGGIVSAVNQAKPGENMTYRNGIVL